MAVTVGSARVGDTLLDAMRRHPQIPGLGTSIARIVSMTDSNAESIQELRNVILADVYLTQRILSIANSVGYRRASGPSVTTVSRAIVLIGFEQVKLLALSILFVDQLPDKERAVAMKGELIQALQASLLAREMARQLAPDDNEKAAIAALLGTAAKLLMVMIDLDSFHDISKRVTNGATEASAAQEVLGMSLQTLNDEVLLSWGIPDAIVSLGTRKVTPADAKKISRLERIVGLAKTTAQHLRYPHGAKRDALIAAVRRECVAESGVTGEVFDRWVGAADDQMKSVRAMLESVIPDPFLADDGFPEGTVIGDSAPVTGPLDAVGKPANSHELVLSKLQDLTLLIAERHSLSAILLTALECLHTGFGYSRSVLLLKDAGTLKMRARVWCGAITKAQADQLEIDIDSPDDLFAAAIRRGSDLQIQNALAPAVALRLPRYFTKACPQTTSFIVLPILSENASIACILVGRDLPEPEPISPEDMRLLRTERGQIILAMKTVR